jgi:hypothetical protein
MATKKKKSYPPPPPPDPENWQLIETKEGNKFWRRKRGTVKKAKLNEAFKRNIKLNNLVSPAATEIRKKLLPYLEKMETGRFIAKVSGRLRKMYKDKGRLDLQAMNGYDLQPYFPLNELLKTSYQSSIKNEEVILEIQLYKGIIGRTNKIITGYWFEAILLYGDLANPKTLRTDSERSLTYDINLQKKDTCILSVMLPSKKTSWILILKAGCDEDGKPAYYARHYGMKVIMAGTTK